MRWFPVTSVGSTPSAFSRTARNLPFCATRWTAAYPWYFYFRGIPLERPIPLERITYHVIPEEAHSLARILDIEDFFQSRHPIIRGHLCNFCVWQLGDRVRPKTRSISESEILAQALKNVEKIDFIGLYERLEEDSSRLCRFLGIRESVSLPHENKSENRPSLSDLPPKALELAKRLTDLDRRLYESVVNKILRHS